MFEGILFLFSTYVTEVQYVIPPIVNVRRAQTEIDLLSSCVCHDECKEPLIGKSACEQSFEDDMNTDPIYHRTNSNVQLYNKVIEKMVVYVRVKLLQL